jgi:hypothetical protein
LPVAAATALPIVGATAASRAPKAFVQFGCFESLYARALRLPLPLEGCSVSVIVLSALTSATKSAITGLMHCSKDAHGLQHSFDDLVGELLKMQWHVEVEHFCGLEVDDKFKLRWVLHGKVAGFGAPEYLINIACRLPELVGRIDPVRNQSASPGEKSKWIDRWQPEAFRQCDDEVAIRYRDSVRRDDETAVRLGCKSRKAALNFGAAMHAEADY